MHKFIDLERRDAEEKYKDRANERYWEMENLKDDYFLTRQVTSGIGRPLMSIAAMQLEAKLMEAYLGGAWDLVRATAEEDVRILSRQRRIEFAKQKAFFESIEASMDRDECVYH